MKPISLAVIDSYNLIRYAFSQQLRMIGFNVTIEANDGEDFFRQIETEAVPNVCIVDIDTPFIHQFNIAIRIKRKFPNVKILAYTLYEKNYQKVERYGIDRFLGKGCSIFDIKDEIIQVTMNELHKSD